MLRYLGEKRYCEQEAIAEFVLVGLKLSKIGTMHFNRAINAKAMPAAYKK